LVYSLSKLLLVACSNFDLHNTQKSFAGSLVMVYLKLAYRGLRINSCEYLS